MIFITVGTSVMQFNRLLKIVDELCNEKIIDQDNIIAQRGYCTYEPINYRCFDFVSRERHHRYLEDAEYIITHSGTGSVISALKMNKKVIAFPRLYKYGEHVDNHQIDLIRPFEQKKYILSAMNKEELIECIRKIKAFKTRKFISNTNNIVDILNKYID